jgi:uncharacterized protein YdhG (YjbR/CyaY superfamily)
VGDARFLLSEDTGHVPRMILRNLSRANTSIQFPLEKPLPLALIRKITAFRVRESIEEDRKWRT